MVSEEIVVAERLFPKIVGVENLFPFRYKETPEALEDPLYVAQTYCHILPYELWTIYRC